MYGVVGLLLAVAVIIPPVYVYMTDQRYAKLFPVLGFAKRYLTYVTTGEGEPPWPVQPWMVPEIAMTGPVAMATDETVGDQPRAGVDDGAAALRPPANVHVTTPEPPTSAETYRVALFQLLDDTEMAAPCLALFSFAMGCLNVPLNVLLIAGTIFRSPGAMLPWLVLTLTEHIIVGIPLIVFFGLISLYMTFQLQLYITVSFIMGGILSVFLISLSSWFTAYACYNEFGDPDGVDSTMDNTEGTSCGDPLTQPLLPNGTSGLDQQPHSGPPPLPPGHPAGGSGGYHLGQYPQYYPPHSGGQSGPRQLPSAPQLQSGMYPHLPAV